MNLYKKKYIIESDKVRKEKIIALISDLHADINTNKEVINMLTADIMWSNPDIICFAGDLVDDAKEMIESGKFYDLINWFYALSQIAPVCLVKGNHDYFSIDKKTKDMQYYDSQVLFDELANIPNVYVLDDGQIPYVLEELTINGFDLEASTTSYFLDCQESELGFLQYVEPILSKIEDKMDEDKMNILLYHAPENMQKRDNRYDLLLTGHMHNGILPNFLDQIIPGNRGLIAPISGLFPAYARGRYKVSENTTGIIASPITTITGLNEFKLVRTLYKPGIQYVKIKRKN